MLHNLKLIFIVYGSSLKNFFLQELRMLMHVEKEKEKENILPVTKLKFQDHLCMSPMLGFHHMHCIFQWICQSMLHV